MSAPLPALKTINGTVKALLKELIQASEEKRSKAVPVLREAYRSLKSCPIQFTSLQQMHVLSGFGQALIDKLEMLLYEWCEKNGKRYVDTHVKIVESKQQEAINHECDEETDSDLDTSISVKKARTKKAEKQKAEKQPKTKKPAKASSVKEPKIFVPQHRTGTHGILVALFTLTPDQPEPQEAEDRLIDTHYYSKTIVIHFAQPYSDSKYIPKISPSSGHGFGGSFHSAWGGMKTLINRGYVYRRNNPACFGLSHQGWQVAKTCVEREKGLTAGCNVDKIGSIASSSKHASDEPDARKDGGKASSRKAKSSPATTNEPFLYTYLTDTDPVQHTTLRKQARIRLNDEDFRMMYRITFAKQLKEHPFVKTCVQDMVEEGELLCGWVKDSVCNEVAPGIGTSVQLVDTTKTSTPVSASTAYPESRVPLKSVIEPQAAASQTVFSSQGCSVEVIDLLTSSDTEWQRYDIPIKQQTMTRKQVYGSESDSDLSDLLPTSRPTKRTKAKR
jgi:hypothetical protein